MMKKLAFLFTFIFAFGFSQQNPEFRKVKDFYDNHRFMLAKEFKKRLDSEERPFERSVIRSDFEEFMQKMDSIQNTALIGALITVKNNEDLKNIHDHTLPETILHPKSPDKIETQATYPGGMQQMRSEVAKLFYFDGIVGPDKTMKTDVVFVVEKDGSVSSVNAFGDNFTFNRQAEIAVYMLPEKFSPAKVNGMAVRYRFRLPLTMNFQ